VKTLWIFLLAYLAGSVNFAVIFFKLTGREDPRQSFSGNAGTTNVYRQAGFLWAAFILLLDVGRAMAVAWVSGYFLRPFLMPWAAFFLVLGNRFPCFHGFRGGKGVANYLGFTIMTAPWAALASAAVWVFVYGLARVPFIASFFMVFTLAFGQASACQWHITATCGAMAAFALILLNHRKNVADYLKRAGKDVSR